MWAVIKKEFKSYFYTPIGYIFIGVFLVAFSISFYFSVISSGNVNFEYIYYTLPTILVLAFIIPLLTMRSFSEERKTEFACPYLNNAVLEELGYIYNENEPVNLGRTLVLPPKYLDPIAPGEGMKLLRCEDTISIHHYSASWMGNKTRLKRRIIRIIGQENVSKIKQFCQRLKMG